MQAKLLRDLISAVNAGCLLAFILKKPGEH